MRLVFEFGKRGRHSLRARNEALLRAVEAMAAEMERARWKIKDVEERHDMLVTEINQLLEERRVANERTWEIQVSPDVREARFQMTGQGLSVGGGSRPI